VRDGCGATVAGCTSDQVAPGKLADGLGWAGIGGGIVLGAVAVAIAIADTRRETRRVAFGFGPGSFALATYF
jgi:hypothetical protein